MARLPLPCPRSGDLIMSGPAEQNGGSREDPSPRAAEDTLGELARLRAQVERLMRERTVPALAGAAERGRDAVEDQSETTATGDNLPGAFDNAMDELMSGFDVRLAEVNRRLDRVLERRR